MMPHNLQQPNSVNRPPPKYSSTLDLGSANLVHLKMHELFQAFQLNITTNVKKEGRVHK
jgi:hypothetical protein